MMDKPEKSTDSLCESIHNFEVFKLEEKSYTWYILSGPRFALKPNFFLLNRFLQEI